MHLRVDVDFDALAQCISDGIAYLDADGRIAAWSDGAAAITGIDRSKAIGTGLDELFARVDPPLGFAVVPERLEMLCSDERQRIVHATVLSIDEGWLISFGREMRFAVIEQLKDEIVAAVSHELKTPIATIKAFAITMRDNPEALAAERHDYLATIEEQADRLSRAVDDLLLLGRVGPKHLLSKRERVTLDAILDDAQARLGPSAASRIERRSTGITLSGDPALLRDAIVHLVDNALKFSPDTAEVLIEGGEDGSTAQVRVTDRGIGIADEHLPYIFERFYRADQNLTAATGGSGLGLTVVHEIVQAHGGSLAVQSTPSRGTTITISLPGRPVDP
ncbi:MAG TPA: PAS domain-containing sensor histidine kinase [Candidatus Baltobacteraceae bacterium]|nr:PAS domain-containing sensor histidine kinase [Candidatus Baltobacteraceae bacterium]